MGMLPLEARVGSRTQVRWKSFDSRSPFLVKKSSWSGVNRIRLFGSFRSSSWILGKGPFGSPQVVAAQGAGGVKDVVRQGVYEIVVGSEDAVVQGRYQLTVHAVDWPEVFDLPPAGILAPNLPAKGAGIIEAPGSVDTFLFTSEEQQQFILEFQHWEPGLLYVDWSIQNQLIGTLYSGNIGTYEKRIFTIQKPGDYRLEIGDGKDAGTGPTG